MILWNKRTEGIRDCYLANMMTSIPSHVSAFCLDIRSVNAVSLHHIWPNVRFPHIEYKYNTLFANNLRFPYIEYQHNTLLINSVCFLSTEYKHNTVLIMCISYTLTINITHSSKCTFPTHRVHT